MSNKVSTEKTIRVIPFSGKQEEWRMWSRKFLARAKIRGYKEVLLGLVDVPDQVEVLNILSENMLWMVL